MLSKQKKSIKRNGKRFAAVSMMLIIVVVLLTAMMSGCLNKEADTEKDPTAGGFSSSLNDNNNEEKENDKPTDDKKTNNPTSSLPDVVVASNSGGGGSRSWALASESNPMIGTWVTELNGRTLVFTGHSDGTFDYELQPPALGRAATVTGKGAYLLRTDSDGTNVMIAYFDKRMVLCSAITVKNNNLIEFKKFTLENGQKIYETPSTFQREGNAVSSEYVPMKLSENIFSENSEIGWGMDTFEEGVTSHTIWKFNDDGTFDFTVLGLGTMIGADTKDLTFSFAYAVFESEEDESQNRAIMYSEEPGYGYELFVTGYEYDEEGYSMALDVFNIENGIETDVRGTLMMWPYPIVNYKVVDKENNEAGAGLMFYSIPDIKDWSVQSATAKENGMIWGHDTAVSEGSTAHPVIGYPNQMPAGSGYYSGFSFNIKTNADDGDDDAEYRPAIGFSSLAEFTPATLGEEKYDALVTELEALDEQYIYNEWYLPEAKVLTDLGIRIYGKTDGITSDITDGASFGIFDTGIPYDAEDENSKTILLINYGAVIVDDDAGHEGTPLALSDEEELVWSDGVQDGYITAEWWIVLDPLYAGGTGTPVDPFQIETAEQMNNVRLNLDRHFILIDDIDLSEYENWAPIGTFVPASPEDQETPDLNYAFIGTFNGDGYTVSNVKIDQSTGAAVGLFGCVAGTTTKIIEFEGMHGRGCMNKAINGLGAIEGVQSIDVVLNRAMLVLTDEYQLSDDDLKGIADNLCNYKSKSIETFDDPVVYDLIVEDVDVTGFMLTGGAVGFAFECVLDNVDLSGTDNSIQGSQMIGGIVGGGIGGDLVGCDVSYAEITLVKDEVYFMGENLAGVLAGGMEDSSIVDCNAKGTVTSEHDNTQALGGLAGCLMGGPFVENCTAEVTITAGGANNNLIGGLLGFSGTFEGEPTEISGCSADAEIIVSGTASRVGGIVGGGYFMTEDELDATIERLLMSEPEETYESLYNEYSYFLSPSMFKISDGFTEGTIAGGFEYVGSIAGCASGSVVEDDCTSTMTWNTESFGQIGEEE